MHAIPALSLKSTQVDELNVCCNNVFRRIFNYNKWESVKLWYLPHACPKAQTTNVTEKTWTLQLTTAYKDDGSKVAELKQRIWQKMILLRSTMTRRQVISVCILRLLFNIMYSISFLSFFFGGFLRGFWCFVLSCVYYLFSLLGYSPHKRSISSLGTTRHASFLYVVVIIVLMCLVVTNKLIDWLNRFTWRHLTSQHVNRLSPSAWRCWVRPAIPPTTFVEVRWNWSTLLRSFCSISVTGWTACWRATRPPPPAPALSRPSASVRNCWTTRWRQLVSEWSNARTRWKRVRRNGSREVAETVCLLRSPTFINPFNASCSKLLHALRRVRRHTQHFNFGLAPERPNVQN